MTSNHKFTPLEIQFLNNKNYLRGKTLDQRFTDIRHRIEVYEHQYSRGLGRRMETYLRNKTVSFSTPALNNFGAFSIHEEQNMNTVPLPASCQILSPHDNIYSILNTVPTVGQMSKLGAGVGINFGKISPEGAQLPSGILTNSRLDWIELAIKTAKSVSQGSSRRGYAVPQLPLDAPEFYDFLDRTSKGNTNPNDPLNDNKTAILLPKGVRNLWENVDVSTMSEHQKEMFKRYRMSLYVRESVGGQYLLDETNMNKNTSPVYKKLGLSVDSSNICTEITTPAFDDYDFTCFLMALNLNQWDKIENDIQIIEDCYMVLDIIVSEYIRLAEKIPGLERAVAGAKAKRDIGLGALGFHELLQSRDMAYGSLGSRILNREIFKTMREVGERVTLDLGRRLGSPELCQEAGMERRNVSLMCIAPNKSTSFICGETSGGIEPFRSNYYTNELAGITSRYRNRNLTKKLEQMGRNTEDVWAEIRNEDGSVMSLDFLSDEEKSVYKKFGEISPKDIIDLAGDRQIHIDMGQSLNLMNNPSYSSKDVYDIHKYAWERDLKTLYYFYSTHVGREKEGGKWDACESCAD